jgi:ribosomal protein L11 methyltransferase
MTPGSEVGPPAERWLELSVEAGPEAVEAVSEILGRVADGTAVRPTRLLRDPADELSVRGDPTAPYVVTAHVPDDPGAAAAVAATERSLWHLQAFGLGPVGALRTAPVTARDWLEAWKAGYVPQRIGRVVVVPSWIDEPVAAGEAVVRIDPGMAFGTGLHPTTRACLALLGELAPHAARVLDLGCGSGILGIAAVRLGAARVLALDTDPVAVATTRANAALNGVASRVTARAGSLPPAPRRAADRFTLIVANLVAGLLVDLAAALGSHLAPGGRLVASGIVAPRADEVLAALAHGGLTLERRVEDADWVTLQLRRSA